MSYDFIKEDDIPKESPFTEGVLQGIKEIMESMTAEERKAIFMECYDD